MNKDTTIPIFIVGSGRSGTRLFYKLLSGISNIEIYHEFICTHIQPLAAKYYMELFSKQELKEKIKKLHGSAIHYSEAKFWVDSSNKLSWIIEPLFEMYPKAKFIHVARDGRKVVSSFFHKLAPEIYDDKSVSIMYRWLENPKKNPEPPPEKKYWWNIPQKGQTFYTDFKNFDQFQRICYHWAESLRVIDSSFTKLPKENKRTYKLEELTSDKKILQEFLANFEVELNEELLDIVRTPQNVFFPMDFKLTDEQSSKFYEIASAQMEKFGYKDKDTYTVKY